MCPFTYIPVSGTQESGTTNLSAHGILYIVATPIGNISDITLRAIETLGSVQLIAAEDTRRTRKLLSKHGLSTPITSFHEHNQMRKTPKFLTMMQEGKNIALVTDAGTPLISDPGMYLVSEARRLGISASPIPGPSAITAALSVAGVPTDRFTFYGFIPKKEGKRAELLRTILERNETAVLYESPHRIKKTLARIADALPQKRLCLARELTKRFESLYYGTAAELACTAPEKGEYVIMMY